MLKIITFGAVLKSHISLVRSVVEQVGLKTELENMKIPTWFNNRSRGQYDANRMIDHLRLRAQEGVYRLVICKPDIFVPTRNFVFGFAHLTDRIIVMSTKRLNERFYDRPYNRKLTRRRIRVVVIHELGHAVAGLPHCASSSCVMASVAQIEELDKLPDLYCEGCQKVMTMRLNPEPVLVAAAGPEAEKLEIDHTVSHS